MPRGPLRLVFVSWEYPPYVGGGIGTYVTTMSRLLARRGHRVTVITVTPEPCPCREIDGTLEVIRLPTPRELLCSPGGGEPACTLAHWQARAEQVSALLRRLTSTPGQQPIDAIEFADYRGEALAYLSATRPGQRPPCIIRLHTPLCILNRYNQGHTRSSLLEAFENECLLLADRLVSPSHELARQLAVQVPGLRPIDILPYPIDPALAAAEPPQVPERAEVLFVGRIEQRKGVETLFAALPRFLDSCPDASLHLVGGDMYFSDREPSMIARLRAMLSPRHAERVVFHGQVPREQIFDRYLASRLCVFPSLFENFPNVCLEAMALARPVVGADNGGMPEMIEHGVSGLISRAGDPADLAANLIRLFSLPAGDRAAIGAAARRRVLDLYHPDRITDHYESLYRSFTPASSSAPPHASSLRHSITPPPPVSVIIPCFNHGRFVEEALASARAQTWPSIRTVIVDDGSTDPHTLGVLARLERDAAARTDLRIIRQPNRGLAAARNAGIRATDTPFFVPLDADDLLAPDFVESLIAPLLADPTLGYCYSHCQYFGDDSGIWHCPDYRPEQLLVGNLSVAAAVVRRDAFDQAGGYSEDMHGGFEDWDFWLALLSVGFRGRCVPRPLFLYRQHAGGSMLTHTQRRRPELIARMIEHHRMLFDVAFTWALIEKDRMFFAAHMDAWHKSLQIARLTSSANGVLHDQPPWLTPHDSAAAARHELDRILASRAWRTVETLKANPVYRALARARWGPDWRLIDPAEPTESRLARIKGSRSYRMIQTMKRTAVYRWYAVRRYGPGIRQR